MGSFPNEANCKVPHKTGFWYAGVCPPMGGPCGTWSWPGTAEHVQVRTCRAWRCPQALPPPVSQEPWSWCWYGDPPVHICHHATQRWTILSYSAIYSLTTQEGGEQSVFCERLSYYSLINMLGSSVPWVYYIMYPYAFYGANYGIWGIFFAVFGKCLAYCLVKTKMVLWTSIGPNIWLTVFHSQEHSKRQE